jgi:Cu2+-exporting ATPase
LGYTFIYTYRDGYQALKKEHKIKPDLLSSFSSTALLLDGMFFPASAMAAVSSLIRYLVIKSEDHSKKSPVSLFSELPRSVWILKEGVEIEIPLEAVQTRHQR